LLLARHAAFQRVERVEQADRERRTRPHAAAPREIAVVVDFQSAIELQMLQDFPDRRMRDLVRLLDALDLGINHAQAMLKKRRQISAGQIAILVDRRGQHATAMLAIPGGIIGAAPEERNPEWCPADNHGLSVQFH
jgi:hypothetical protein